MQKLIERLNALLKADEASEQTARAHDAQLTKPAGALGRLEDCAAWMAAWQGRHPPRAEAVQIIVFAGNHGIAARGVSAFPAEVTTQMVANFEAGGAAINQLSADLGASLDIHALELENPTRDFTATDAMTEAEFLDAFEAGARAIDDTSDLLCLGEMGIANTTSASTLCHLIFGGKPADWVGRGTGVDEAGLARKTEIVRQAYQHHHAASSNGLDALRRVGGRELAAIAGAVLAARERRIPVLLDGFACCAAASSLFAIEPEALDHCLVSHLSAEQAHIRLVQKIGKEPLLSLNMRLGEASGAALAAQIIRAALSTHNGMASFDTAGVSTSGGKPQGSDNPAS